MNFCTLLNVLILTPSTHLQPHPIIYVSTWANLCFWQYFQVVKQVYFLYCFKNPDKLPDHYSTHKTSLHPISHHFIDQLDHQYYFKFLVSRDVCEASTILALPNGMILGEHLHVTKWLWFAQFELKWTRHGSAPSWSSFLDQKCSCEATAVKLGPFTLKTSRIIVPP